MRGFLLIDARPSVSKAMFRQSGAPEMQRVFSGNEFKRLLPAMPRSEEFTIFTSHRRGTGLSAPTSREINVGNSTPVVYMPK